MPVFCVMMNAVYIFSIQLLGIGLFEPLALCHPCCNSHPILRGHTNTLVYNNKKKKFAIWGFLHLLNHTVCNRRSFFTQVHGFEYPLCVMVAAQINQVLAIGRLLSGLGLFEHRNVFVFKGFKQRNAILFHGLVLFLLTVIAILLLFVRAVEVRFQ